MRGAKTERNVRLLTSRGVECHVLFTSVAIKNFRSIAASGELELGPITVLLGRNNSGKSALLRAVYLLQDGAPFHAGDDVRLRENAFAVEARVARPMTAAGLHMLARSSGQDLGNVHDLAFKVNYENASLSAGFWWNSGQAAAPVGQLRATRPNHAIVPIFARRKSDSYESTVRTDLAQRVSTNDRDLTSRIATLMSGEHPEGLRYRQLVKEILGVSVATYLTENGQQPGLPISSHEGISLARMGEGISSALSLIAELSSPGQRLFLVEEPETDLHPSALRAVLDLIADSTDENQFIVSTHSDLVLRHLGSTDGARVYRSELSEVDGLPTSQYALVNDQMDRLEALAELGYEATIPAGWLAFEESTAERVVGQLLIPMFAPRLARLRTVAARGAGAVPATVADLHRVLLFAHLADRDVPRAWVLIDGDAAGLDALAKLHASFPSWPESRFRALNPAGFESYYPARFAEDVEALKLQSDGRALMRAKGQLAEAVCAWADEHPDDARPELERSAGPVIDVLRAVEQEMRELPA
jgi:predicted ATPase